MWDSTVYETACDPVPPLQHQLVIGLQRGMTMSSVMKRPCKIHVLLCIRVWPLDYRSYVKFLILVMGFEVSAEVIVISTSLLMFILYRPVLSFLKTLKCPEWSHKTRDSPRFHFKVHFFKWIKHFCWRFEGPDRWKKWVTTLLPLDPEIAKLEERGTK